MARDTRQHHLRSGVALVFLDGDPWQAAERLPVATAGPSEDVFTSLLLPIVPWQWDWFGD